MRFLVIPLVYLALVSAAPYDEVEEKTIITKDYYPDELVIYKGDHDIVDIMVPLNSAGSSDVSESFEEDLKNSLLVFFVEADIENGRRIDQGVYVYKAGKAKKVMDTGRAVAASADDSTYVFIGAKDGIYVYNPKKESADKYGDLDINVKDMAKENNNDVIYVLTEDRQLYKVYDSATKKEKIEEIKGAEQIIMDYSNNMYFYGNDKMPYVRTADGEIKEIQGIPSGAKEVRLFRPILFHNEGVEFLVDNEMYTLYPDGRAQSGNFAFSPDAKPTAYSMEASIFRYMGYDKKIYEYDFLTIMEPGEDMLH